MSALHRIDQFGIRINGVNCSRLVEASVHTPPCTIVGTDIKHVARWNLIVSEQTRYNNIKSYLMRRGIRTSCSSGILSAQNKNKNYELDNEHFKN